MCTWGFILKKSIFKLALFRPALIRPVASGYTFLNLNK